MIDVAFTGAAPFTASRKLMLTVAQIAGCKARTSFCSKTNLVVASSEAIAKNTTKVRKAKEAGIRVISYHRFLSEFNVKHLVAN